MSAKIRIGVMFECGRPPEELPGFAAAVEEAGAEDLWVVEDLGWNGGVSAAAVALAATSRLRVGIGIAPAPLRNPALYAMEIATLARIHPGRVVAGLGHGVAEWMRQVGVGAGSKLAVLEESVTVVRGLLSGETVTLDGRAVHIDGVRLVHPPATVPPVVTGVVGPRSLELSGRVADGTILVEGLHPPQLAEAVGHLRRGGATASHEVINFAFLHVDADEERAARAGAEALAGQAAFLGVRPEEVFALVGPASSIPAKVRTLAEAGVRTVVLRPFGGDPLAQVRAALAALAH